MSVLGQKFHRGVVVCLKAPSNSDFPEFGEVSHVLVPEETILLLVRKYHTDCYCSHYNAYCVTKSADYILVSVPELALHDVFHPYNVSSSYFIVIRSCCHIEVCI